MLIITSTDIITSISPSSSTELQLSSETVNSQSSYDTTVPNSQSIILTVGILILVSISISIIMIHLYKRKLSSTSTSNDDDMNSDHLPSSQRSSVSSIIAIEVMTDTLSNLMRAQGGEIEVSTPTATYNDAFDNGTILFKVKSLDNTEIKEKHPSESRSY
ncbi:12008_t:CDS:2 [Gigaspora rosea]|nr:12008_t:CDS:2 [Gigaspora rosea]